MRALTELVVEGHGHGLAAQWHEDEVYARRLESIVTRREYASRELVARQEEGVR